MKKIAITMGEPGGVGPEVIMKALNETKAHITPVVVGNMEVMEEALSLVGGPLKLIEVDEPKENGGSGTVQVIDIGKTRGYRKGLPTGAGGEASSRCVTRAVELAMQGKVDAIVTAPLSKEGLRMAGHAWPGHTEMLAKLTGTKQFRMMLMAGAGKGKALRVILVTIHKALRQVPRLITRKSVLLTIKLALTACKMLRIRIPRIGVASLNPHASESGMFGDEEQRIIAPAVEEAQAEGMLACGPFPPDTLYRRAYLGEFDIVVSMYHDQGLIPLKLVGFDRGVNVTVGLPFVRTSPDHGTAYDIAWRGVADSRSMEEAIKAASTMKVV